MKISRLLMLIGFLTVFAMATHMAIDEDTWWHLRAGQWMVEHRTMITQDLFSYTHYGEPWQYPGLWVQVSMFLIFNQFGPAGLNLWVSIMVVAIFWIVWKTMSGSTILKVAVLLLAAAASSIYWAARPYLLTYLLAAVFVFILERYTAENKGRLWILPVLMVVWVNSHGGFLAGFLILAPYVVEALLAWLGARRQGAEGITEKSKLVHLLLAFGISLAATIINPSGLGLWKLPFTTVARHAEQLFIAEWQSPDFHITSLQPFAIMLVLLLAALGGSNKQFRISQLLLAAGFGLLGLYSVRNIFFFVIAASPLLSASLTALLDQWKEKLNLKITLDFERPPTTIQNAVNWSLLGFFILVVAGRVYTYLPSKANWEIISSQFPVEAVAFIRAEQPDGNLFNAYNFGGYCIWALPEYPVFVDGRADLHQDEIILEWYRTVNVVGDWEDVLTRWDVGVVLLEPGQPLAEQLVNDGWSVGFQDEMAVVLLKN